MTITCTQEEQEQLIACMASGNQYAFAKTPGHICTRLIDCGPCLEKGIDWVIRKDDSEIEMSITHNDGSIEYISDIDSIGLLASKDYGITYYGEIRKAEKNEKNTL